MLKVTINDRFKLVDLFKVNQKGNRIAFFNELWTNLPFFFSVVIVDFEHVLVVATVIEAISLFTLSLLLKKDFVEKLKLGEFLKSATMKALHKVLS